jgi:hypothetical protein
VILGVAGIAAAALIGGGLKFFLDSAGPHPERAKPEERGPVAGMPAPAPPPVKYKWTFKTDPPGAEVVRGDGKVVGKTPLENEHEAAKPTKVDITLRLAGYQDKKLTLELAQNVEINEKLVPAGKAEEPAAAEDEEPKGKKKKKGKKKGK